MYKILAIIVPIVLVIIISIIQENLFKSISDKRIKAILYIMSGLVGSFLIYRFILYSSIKTGCNTLYFGSYKGLLLGIVVGVCISIFSGLFYFLANQPKLNIPAFHKNLEISVIANMSPAIVEEFGFRGGVVHFLQSYYGKMVGLAGGSISFGIVHIIGRMFGNPVGISHITGVTIAGLLLSLLYMKYGLFSAIGCHWIWNSLCNPICRMFGIPDKGGTQVFEGAWTTILVYVCISSFIIYKL